MSAPLNDYTCLRRFVKLMLILAAMLSISSRATQIENSQRLQDAQTLLRFENWGELGKSTSFVDSIICSSDDITCLHLMVIRSEYLHVSKKFKEAQAVLDKLYLLLSGQDETTDSLYIKQLAKLSIGVGQRHSGQLLRAQATLRDLLTEPLNGSVRLRAIGELAYALYQNGDHQTAHELYQRQVIEAKQANVVESELFGSVGLALIAKDRGEHQIALKLFSALANKMESPDQASLYLRRLGFVHGNLGAIHKQLGQFSTALRHYVRARDLVLKVDAQLYRVDYLDLIASIQRLMGEHKEALRVIREEYLPFASQPSRRYVAYREIALNFAALKRWDAASDEIRKAIDIRMKAGIVRRIGDYHADWGNIELGRGAYISARERFFKGLVISIEQRDPESQWKNCFGLYQTLRAARDDVTAIFWGKRTVQLLQQSRARLLGADDFTQYTYMSSVEHIYRDLADVLANFGRLAEAELILSMLKDQELHELTRSSSSELPNSLTYSAVAQLTNSGPEVQQARLLDTLSVERTIATRELEQLKKREDQGESLSAADKARLAELERITAANGKALEDFFAKLQSSLSADAGSASKMRTDLQAGATNMETLLRKVGPGHVGLQYVVTPERLSILLSLPEGTFARQMDLPSGELNRLVLRLRDQLKTPSVDPRPTAQALHKLLIAPIASELAAAKAHTLVLNLTDLLRYIPFGVLHDGQGYLLEKYAVALYTPAANQDIAPIDTKAWQVAGMGATQATRFDDDNASFKALPAVKGELAGIVRTSSTPGGALPGQITLDPDFTRTSFTQALRRFPVLHVASHFQFAPNSEDRSYLVLGDGTRLSLADLNRMDFTRVQLLALSACDTASGGGRNEKGSEIEGLGAAVQRRGAKTVLATLWPVADESTAAVMQRFYQLRSPAGAAAPSSAAPASSPSTALSLRQAQLELLQGKGAGAANASEQRTGSTARSASTASGSLSPPAERAAHPFMTDPDKPFAHPYYWAPFILMGNWL
jgi:CHAT domain-containing protein